MNKLLSFLAAAAFVFSMNTATAQPQDFTLTDTKGNSYNLFDLLGDGNQVMLDFFATWCGPCKSSTPALQGMWEYYRKGDGGFYVLGIDVDPSETDAMVEDFKKQYGPNADYPGFTGQPARDVYTYYNSKYGSGGIPLFVLISPNGDDPNDAFVQWANVGYGSSTEDAMWSQLQSPTSVQEVANMSSMNIYPNPFQSEAFIEFNLTETTNIAINVYDVTGKMVQEFTNTNYNAGNHKLMIDGTNLNEGLYYVNVRTDEGVTTHKVMLSK